MKLNKKNKKRLNEFFENRHDDDSGYAMFELLLEIKQILETKGNKQNEQNNRQNPRVK